MTKMAKKRKITKASKRRLSAFGTISVIIIILFFVTLIQSVISIYNLNQKNQKLERELKNLQGSAKNLNVEIDKLQDKDYLARYARENYLYTKNGEYVIKIDKKEKQKEVSNNVNVLSNEIISFGTLGAIFIILYIMFKHRKYKKKKSK